VSAPSNRLQRAAGPSISPLEADGGKGVIVFMEDDLRPRG
jgi:hypothetical protein